MRDFNEPQNAKEKREYFKSKKLMALELLKEICEDGLTSASEITGLINNKIDELDERLEG